MVLEHKLIAFKREFHTKSKFKGIAFLSRKPQNSLYTFTINKDILFNQQEPIYTMNAL